MRLENNFIQVENNPVVINKVNSVAAAFGWTVQSIQVTDSAVAYSSGSVTWATEFGAFTTNNVSVNRTTYASISYQRDMDDPKYKDWLSLENEYNEMSVKSYLSSEEEKQLNQIRNNMLDKYTKFYGTSFTVWQCLIIILGLFVFLIGFPIGNPMPCLIAGVIMAVGGYALFGFVKRKVLSEAGQYVENKLLKDDVYISLVQTEAARRDKARKVILDRARML